MKLIAFVFVVALALSAVAQSPTVLFESQRIETFDVITLSTINTGFQEFKWNINTSINNNLYLMGEGTNLW